MNGVKITLSFSLWWQKWMMQVGKIGEFCQALINSTHSLACTLHWFQVFPWSKNSCRLLYLQMPLCCQGNRNTMLVHLQWIVALKLYFEVLEILGGKLELRFDQWDLHMALDILSNINKTSGIEAGLRVSSADSAMQLLWLVCKGCTSCCVKLLYSFLKPSFFFFFLVSFLWQNGNTVQALEIEPNGWFKLVGSFKSISVSRLIVQSQCKSCHFSCPVIMPFYPWRRINIFRRMFLHV